jgi:hypothetical protein
MNDRQSANFPLTEKQPAVRPSREDPVWNPKDQQEEREEQRRETEEGDKEKR